MQSLQRITTSTKILNPINYKLSPVITKPLSNSTATYLRTISTTKSYSSDRRKADDEWNDAWETAWLPDELAGKNRAPWETDVNFGSAPSSSSVATDSTIELPADVDSETKAFVEDMNENWNERRRGSKTAEQQLKRNDSSLYSLEKMKKDYRLNKQRIHAGLWMKEIEKQEEAKLADSTGDGGDDMERLLDSCSEIFDTPNNDLNNSKVPISSELKNKPDGWESTSKAQDGNIWEMSQREEDILRQEFDRRIAYSKFQRALSRTHIFSRRRPIDGWKYMIEELGPNAKKGKGSVSRLLSLSDPSTQPFKEEKTPIANRPTSFRGR